MNKITTNSQCECNVNNDTALRLVAGNDFTMRLRLTKKDGELIVPYDLTDAQDLTVNAFGHSGDSIELDSFIEDSSHVIVSIDADEFESYIPYSIEIKWYDEPYDRRSCAANLFMFVTTQQEANEAQDTIVAGPYDYQIEITNDVAYVIVGAIPSTDGTVTEEELEETLENYVTNSSLSTTLNDYVTDNQLSLTLQSYIDETELSSTLSSYATTQYVDDAIEDIDIDTSNFYTKTEIDTTLQSYITESELNTTLNPYVTDNQLSSTLQSYVTESALDNTLGTTLNAYATSISIDGEHLIVGPSISKVISLNNSANESISAIDLPAISVFNNNGTLSVKPDYISTGLIKATDARKIYEDSIRIDDVESDISHLDTRVTNLENSGGGSGDVTMTYLDNYLEATAYALAQHELDLNTLNRNFSNYYDKITSDSRYVTASQVSSKYVSTSTNENQNQATAYALNDLDGRVTTLEQSSGGGSSATVNDATLTIQKNSVTVSTFTANASTNVTCDISVPTDTNDLTNGANFVSSTSITTIVQISQNDYDALVSGGTVDANTMYVIV